ncbi:MAG: MarC family protein [Candidatus ainarchaeum sp.]|nr:MarC family protein [Candidatus ainarchaeum sp.]
MIDLGFFALVFSSVFLVIDPFANIPVFQLFLEKFSAKDKARTIRKSCIIAFGAFFLFSFVGPFLFSWMGIEFFSFRVAGGILLLIIAAEMLLGFKTRTELTSSEQEQAEEKENLTVTPLAIPLITGPGAITTGIVLFSKAQAAWDIIAFIGAGTLAFVACYALLSQSGRISKFLSPIGMKIITRIMGLLLMSLAVQFILTGLKESGLFLLA